MTNIIEIADVSCSYGKKQVLRDISFSVRENTIFFLMGNNGSGKTTLMNCILNNRKVQKGNIYILGKSVSEMSEKELSKVISYVPQIISINCEFKVKDYLVLGRNPYISLGNPSDKDYSIVFETAEKMKLGDILEHKFNELSGGQKQWCSIARALIQETPIIIMDEPMSALDMGKQSELLLMLKRLIDTEKKTVILTTHNPNHCMKLESEVCWLHEKSVCAVGKSHDVFTEDRIKAVYGEHVCLNPYSYIDFDI